MHEPGPEARNRGAIVPNHRGRKVRKKERFSKDWKKVCFIGWETRRRMCPHIQEAQNESHTTIVAGTQKAATKVLALKKQKLLPRNIVTKESIREEQKQCQKAKEVHGTLEVKAKEAKVEYEGRPIPTMGMRRNGSFYSSGNRTKAELQMEELLKRTKDGTKTGQIHPSYKNTERNSSLRQKEVKTPSADDNPSRKKECQQVLEEKIQVAIHPKHPKQTVAIGSTLTEEGQKEMCGLLRRRLDVFAWKPADMTGVPRHIAEHMLNEVHYHSWLSNPVMVKKHDDSWRMCVDFKDLNKACPKDGYPLPEIDWKRRMRKIRHSSQAKEYSFTQKCRSDKKRWSNLPAFSGQGFLKTDWSKPGEAEWAFKEMKQSIAKLPMLTAPKENEELIMYLAAAKEAISAVLMTKRDGKQVPVYFISRALQGPEINYTLMEKIILALVSASKRLKRYFQAHTIVVITDQPIKQLLSNPELTGRLLKWRFVLGEHDIQYRPRTSVKGQILSDFIMERPEDDAPDTPMEDKEELPDPWILFTDGSSCVDGSGAGLIITNPEGMEFTYTLREKAIDEKEILAVVEEERHTWMTPVYEYLTEGILPEEKKKARTMRRKEKLTPITSPWPFYKWGIDIAGPFPKGPIILGKIGMPTLRTAEVDMVKNNEALGISLDLLEEKREQAAIQEARNKAKMEG
nr:reverse transcriptase domain-containing protein [Tanacetum cinerariifolium]